ncbi:MAG TPA: hypothetical protein VGM90_31555 [Kofleriaceae bacterium]|jgi:hypothetical protein
MNRDRWFASRVAAAMGALVWIALLLVGLSPQRFISNDTTPSRLGAAALRCGGDLDLLRVDWVRDLTPDAYWLQRVNGQGVSAFGPAPAVFGAAVMPTLADGDLVDDDLLRRRERFATALSVGFSAALLALAIAARRSVLLAFVRSAIALASFAGAATIGQGLWQATSALPLLMGAFAALSWASVPRTWDETTRAGRWPLRVVPALLLAAMLARPTIAPLCLGLGVAWISLRPRLRDWLVAIALAAIAAAPFVAWNSVVLGHLYPTGQAAVNARVDVHLFVFAPGHIGTGVWGLLVSPARGLVWFAPVVLLAVARSLRGRRTDGASERIVAGAIVLQLVAMALFYRWWGGVCFGPRLLAEAVWIAVGVASWRPFHSRVWHGVFVLAALVTIGVGQIGLWRWRAEAWERRRNPDIDENALWDVHDSPIPAALTYDVSAELLAIDGGEPRVMRCRAGRLETVAP